MKRVFIYALICAFVLSAKAQIIHFSYDSSGNRISRTLLGSNSYNARTRGVTDNIHNDTTNIPNMEGYCGYTYFFDGSILHIKFNDEVKSDRVVTIFSLAGIRLSSKSSNDNEFVFDLSEEKSTMFVITILEPGMDNQVIKILK